MGLINDDNSYHMPSFARVLGTSSHSNLAVRPRGSSDHVQFSDEKAKAQRQAGLTWSHTAGLDRVWTRTWLFSAQHTLYPNSHLSLCSWGFRARISGKTNWTILDLESRTHNIPGGLCLLGIEEVSMSSPGQGTHLVSWEDHLS